jgi:hypothetical protein
MSYELNRKLAKQPAPLPTDVAIDPVTADIVRGAFETVCFEAATHLGRAASSPIINQSNERNAAIIDSHGRLATGAIGTPHLTFASQLTVRYGLMMLDEYDWGPGDVFLGNDPDYGGGHLPDYNVYGPVYDDAGELVTVIALQAHQGDTGGKDPGGFTLEATDIFTEGLAIPCLKLVHRGEKRRDVIKLVERNNRFQTFAGDLAAMIGAVQQGAKRIEALIRNYGTPTIRAAIDLPRYGIRVNCLVPGHIRTPLSSFGEAGVEAETAERLDRAIDAVYLSNQPLKRRGEPEDAAQAVLFLASDRARQITGITLPVEAGVTAGDPINHLRDIFDARFAILNG